MRLRVLRDALDRLWRRGVIAKDEPLVDDAIEDGHLMI